MERKECEHLFGTLDVTDADAKAMYNGYVLKMIMDNDDAEFPNYEYSQHYWLPTEGLVQYRKDLCRARHVQCYILCRFTGLPRDLRRLLGA